MQIRNQIVFFIGIAFLFASWWFLTARYDHSEPSSSSRIAWACTPFALFFIMIVGHKLVLGYTFKHHGLSCPACGKPLGGVEAIVIATGNCGNCGERILESPPGA